MTIVIEIDDCTAKRIARALRRAGIPVSAVPEMVRALGVEMFADENTDESFLAESYVYRNRTAASRAAQRLHRLYPATRASLLRYRHAGAVVSAEFVNGKRRRAN